MYGLSNTMSYAITGGLSSSEQQKILDSIAKSAPMSDIISDVITAKRERDSINIGLWYRYQLKPATNYNWWDSEHKLYDPRLADGVPILARPPISENDVNDRLHVPFDRTIATNKASYAASNVVQAYGEDIPDSVKDAYTKFNYENGIDQKYLDMMESCADRGTSYVLLFNDGNSARVSRPKEWEAAVIYDPKTNLPQYAVHYVKITNKQYGLGGDVSTSDEYMVDWYDGVSVTSYQGAVGSFVVTEPARPHTFGTVENPVVPLIAFDNNDDKKGNVEMTLSMQDAYDMTMSDLSTEVAQMRLAYLVAKMIAGDPNDTETAAMIKKTGTFFIDEPDGDVKFVTKDLNVDAVKYLSETLRHLIYQQSKSYDPDSLGQAEQTAYQIRQKLYSTEQDAKQTWGQWNLSFINFDNALYNYWRTFGEVRQDYDISGIKRSYIPNVPRNVMLDLKDAFAAGIQISNRTKLELASLDINVDEEMERLDLEGGFVETVEGEPTVGITPEGVSLNGAQIQAVSGIAEKVALGELSRPEAVELAKLVGLDSATAEKVIPQQGDAKAADV